MSVTYKHFNVRAMFYNHFFLEYNARIHTQVDYGLITLA